jgi:predicted nucleotidyltransferase
MLIGSLGRGDSLPASDVDLLAVVAANGRMQRFIENDVLVEVIARTEEEWLERFSRPRPTWIYAFLEGRLLYDETGVAARLVDEAGRLYSAYRTPSSVLLDLASTLWHGKAKLLRAEMAGGEHAGFWASVIVGQTMIDALFAVYNRPQPPGSRRFDLLDTLNLPPSERNLVRVACTGTAEERLAAVRDLLDLVEQRLPDPDLLVV